MLPNARAKTPTRAQATATALALAVAGGTIIASIATARPGFKLTVTPKVRTVAPGGTVTHTFRVKRARGFRKPVTLTVTGLPAGATAEWRLRDGRALPRRRRGRGPYVLSVKASAGSLVIRVRPGTPAGSRRPVVRAGAGRVRRKATLSLTVASPTNPAATPSDAAATPSAPATAAGPAQEPPTQAPPADTRRLRVIASPGVRRTAPGGRTTFGVQIERTGVIGPVTLGVQGLPPGATALVAPAPLAGDSATVTIDASDDTPLGTSDLTITANGDGTTAAGAATLVVAAPAPFTISGGVAAKLRPGATEPIDLELTNPNDEALAIGGLKITATTAQPGCDADRNYKITPVGSAFPLVLPPGTTRLADLVPAADLPALSMLSLSDVDQDACKGARLTLTYQGIATR